jgi:hypothetical protein
MADQIQRAYAKEMSSLTALELTCEEEEANLTAKLLSLQLAKDDGADVTGAVYEEVDGGKLGHLIFEEFTTDVDAGSREAIHKTKGEPLVCRGQAYISGHATNVLVFREK